MHSQEEIRARLMEIIAARVQELGLSGRAAADRAGIIAPRMYEIKSGRSSYGIDPLLSVARRLGVKVNFRVEPTLDVR